MRRSVCLLIHLGMGAAFIGLSVAFAAAQTSSTQRPDDAPSIRVGATLFTDYTYTERPQITDADGNTVHASQFNVTRSYINVTGQLSHLVAFRITPDIVREAGTALSTSGSLVFRIKYAYGQVNLDDWLPRGSWARLGIHQTPFVDFDESIYRYRFQGTIFVEREGYLSSSDAGASFHAGLPSDYGDVHVGIYNGETYSRLEVNDQKALQIRGTARPFATQAAALRGLRVTAFYDADHNIRDGDRARAVVSTTYEHPRLHAGFQHLNATDRTSVTAPEIEGSGYSLWATPRLPGGWEGLLRVDRLTPSETVDLRRHRTILGVAYWPRMQGPVTAALLFDVESVSATGTAATAPDQRRLAVHALVQF